MVIVEVPCATPVTDPSFVTVAFPISLEVNVTVTELGCTEKVSFLVSTTLTLMLESVNSTMVTDTLAGLLVSPSLATTVIVAVPAFAPVAVILLPEIAERLTTPEGELLHVYVTSPSAPVGLASRFIAVLQNSCFISIDFYFAYDTIRIISGFYKSK